MEKESNEKNLMSGDDEMSQEKAKFIVPINDDAYLNKNANASDDNEAQEELTELKKEISTDIQESINQVNLAQQEKLKEWEKRLEEKEIELIRRETEMIGEAERMADERIAFLKSKYLNLLNEVTKKESELADLEATIRTKQKTTDAKYSKINETVENEIGIRYGDLLEEKTRLEERLAATQKTICDLNEKYAKVQESSNAQLLDQVNKLKGELGRYKELGPVEELINLTYRQENYKKVFEENIELNKKLMQVDCATEIQYKNEIQEQIIQSLENRINEFQKEANSRKTTTRSEMLSAFNKTPEVLLRPDLPPISESKTELDWLKNIAEKTNNEGIEYPMRLWACFHTCLKINDWAQLTILSGVSGTGKSEMPKRYAKHGGMNFVLVPVKPEWDSPSSMFGYYNTLENRFEATELTRILYYMNQEPYNNNLLLVLLDEMNLAHPELYFSDLLSKMEDKDNTPTIDLALGAGEPEERIEIRKNILWTGTMNEDETTKGLSDKVIDRSSILTFPAPKELISSTGIKNLQMTTHLDIGTWNHWKNTRDDDTIEFKEMIEAKRKCVNTINASLNEIGRNVGHRVWQTIQNYIRNYPYVISGLGNKDSLQHYVDIAFSDAVALKLMPKMRGIDVDESKNRNCLEQIRSCIQTEAKDLETDYEKAMDNGTHVFRWQTGEYLYEEIE